MKKIKFLIIGGLLFLVALPSFASNGNPRLNDTIPGVGTALVFCNTRPYQDDTATAGSLRLLETPANYYIDATAYPGYVKYGVTSTPVSTTRGYLLLKDGTTKYAVRQFTLGTPVGPSDEPFEPGDITWYNTGIPDAPSSLAESHGFETARVTWTLNPDPSTRNFEYTSIELTVTRVSDGAVIEATGGVSPTILTGGSISGPYSMGEYVDGRILETNTEYEVSLVGVVQANAAATSFYRSPPATITYRTLSGAAAGPLTIDLEGDSLGLNQFALPFAAVVGGTDIVYLSDLVGQINASGAAENVTMLGWWDEDNQIDRGYMITYSGGSPVYAPVNAPGGDATVINVEVGRVYQVSVNSDVSVTFEPR